MNDSSSCFNGIIYESPTPPVNESNGRKEATQCSSVGKSLKRCETLLLSIPNTYTALCVSRNMLLFNVCMSMWVYVGRFFLRTHTRGTRVLLISAWAAERPLKVSLKWWMFCWAQASVFNLSHWRNSATSTSNNFLSSAVRDRSAQMWTLSPPFFLRCFISLAHFLNTFVYSLLLKRNVNSRVYLCAAHIPMRIDVQFKKWDGTLERDYP